MIILDTITKTLEVVLGGTVTTNQLPFVAAYADIETTTFGVSGMASSNGASNNTTAVTLVSAPAASTARSLKTLTVYNADTVATTVTIQYNDNATLRTIWKGALAVGDTLMYTDGDGWRVMDSDGNTKMVLVSQASVSSNGTATDNALVRWDGTTGGVIQNSGIIIDDSNNVTGVGQLAVGGQLTQYGGAIFGTDASYTDFLVSNTASAVNYVQATGSATGGFPTISGQGSDTNVGLNLVSKGSGWFRFYTDTDKLQLYVGHTPLAVNYLRVGGGATGVGPHLLATGSETNVDLLLWTKGAGSYTFVSHTDFGPATQFVISATASAVNYLQVTGAVTTASPSVVGTGSDTNIGIDYKTKGSGAHVFYTGLTAPQFVISHTASAVNYLAVTGGVVANAPGIVAGGSDTDVGISIITKGAGTAAFYAGTGSHVTLALGANAGSTDYFTITPATGGPRIYPAGTSTNINFVAETKGTGSILLRTNSTVAQVHVLHTASAVNYLTFTGGATGSPGTVTIAAAGSDTNVSIAITPKGSGYIALSSGVSVSSYDHGTVSSGTTTPDPRVRGFQHMTNGGASAIAPSSNIGSVIFDITNNGSAGALTTSGFTWVDGDPFTTTNGHKFRCSIVIGNNGSTLTVKAMQ